MDQTMLQLPISQQVKECLDANMSIDEGSQYIGLYHNGYALIASLIRICQLHTDPLIKTKAQGYLDEIDRNGGIGTTYRAAYRFSMVNKVKAKARIRQGDKGMRRLSPFEHNRITELASRSDLDENEQSEIKRIQASILDEKIATVDYDKLKQISIKHYPIKPKSVTGKKGWTKMEERTYTEVQTLLDRPDVNDLDKKRIYQLMDGIVDGRMPTIDYLDAAKILADNRASKKEIAKRGTASKVFENAIFMACQACDNLEDMKIPVLPKANRVNLVAKISTAAASLLRIQTQLLQEEEDEGGNQRGIRGRQKSLSDLAPVTAPIPGESRKEDSK